MHRMLRSCSADWVSSFPNIYIQIKTRIRGKKVKKQLLFMVCCLFFLMSSIFSANAQDLSEEAIRIVNENLDNFFPITMLEEKYDRKAPSLFGNLGPDTATETNTNDTRNLLLFANPDGVSAYGLTEKVNVRSSKNFYYSADITPNDLYPQSESGCYIGYINDNPSYNAEKEPVKTTSLVLSDAIYLESRSDEGLVSERKKLADLQNPQTNLMIVRLAGETLLFADGELIGTYHDELNGPFSLRYGAVVYAEGEVADCSFDNLTVREVMK